MNKKTLIVVNIVLLFLAVLFLGCPSSTEEIYKEMYTITFDPNNGEPVFQTLVDANSFIEFPENPTKEGWAFDCWCLIDGTPVNPFSTRATSDVTFVADWNVIIRFINKNEEQLQSIDVDIGAPVSSPKNPSYETADGEFSFLYWSLDKYATEDEQQEKEVDLSKGFTTSPVDVYAIYSEYYVFAEKKSSDYLVIMYMDGDNNLNDSIFLDMNEVEYGLYQIRNYDGTPKNDYASVNVVALWDGWTGDESYTPFIGTSATKIYEFGRDYSNRCENLSDPGCVLSKNTIDYTSTASWITDANGEVDMGDKQTLINFLNWVNERYEAEKVILQFSNHGAGPRSAPVYVEIEDGLPIRIDNTGRRALCWDDSSYSESFLKTKDVSEALAEAGYGTEKKLDMILMDVCLGAAIEDAYQFKDYAKYLVGSPNVVPGNGMDYVNIMKSFTANSTIESVGTQLIDDYADFYRWNDQEWSSLLTDFAEFSNSEVTAYEAMYLSEFGDYFLSTLSMLDLSEIDVLEDKISNLATLLLANKDKKIVGIYFDESGKFVYEATEKTTEIPYLDLLKEFVVYGGVSGYSIRYRGTFSWLFDIGYMMDKIAQVATPIVTTQNGDKENPNGWPELLAASEEIKESLEAVIVKAWRDSPCENENGELVDLYEYLGGTHYGLTISGRSVFYDGKDIDIQKGNCPDFYRTDLAFGADSAWTDLLVEFFGELDEEF